MNRLLFFFLLLAPSLMAQPAPFLRNAWTTNAAGTPVQGQDNLSVTNLGSGTNWLFHSVRPQTIARLIDITNVALAVGGGTNYWTNDPPGYVRPITLTNSVYSGTNEMTGFYSGDFNPIINFWGGPYDSLRFVQAVDAAIRPNGRIEGLILSANMVDFKNAYINWSVSAPTNSVKSSRTQWKAFESATISSEANFIANTHPTSILNRNASINVEVSSGPSNSVFVLSADVLSVQPMLELRTLGVHGKPFILCHTGAVDSFRVQDDGNLSFVRKIAYSWPTAQGAAQSVLTNDGAGVLGWGVLPAGSGGGNFNINQFEASATHTNIKSAALLTNIISRNITNAGVSVTMASGVELRWPGFTLLENVPGGAQLILNGQFNAIGAVDLDSTLLVNGVGTFDTNVSVLGTNDSRYLKLSGGVPGSSILRTDSNTNVVAATIGTGLSFDGTTLTATASGGGATTNANQFGVAAELTIKSGALLTNVLFYPSNLTGPATIHLPTTAQMTNLTEWRGTNGAVGLAISSNGLAMVQERLDLANAVAFRTNNIDFRLNTYQAFTASLKTNLVLQLTNTYEGVTTRLDAYGAGRLGGGATNAWQLLCTVAAGVNIYWPPGTTNGNYDVLVNSNQVVSFTFMGGLGSTNILASYRVLEGIGAN